jgi:hypothetical protein
MTFVFGSFLAGALITLLIPIALLIGIAAWHARAFTHIPYDPGRTAPHAAGVAEKEGLGLIPQDPPEDPRP